MPGLYKVALRKESVDRNTNLSNTAAGRLRSLSARRAWIEISIGLTAQSGAEVALRKESVDRNHRKDGRYQRKEMVALRKESVDRNQQGRNGQNIKRRVALRKESVDRNCMVAREMPICRASLSARRAWIEIIILFGFFPCIWSLSARRAWIEMPTRC